MRRQDGKFLQEPGSRNKGILNIAYENLKKRSVFVRKVDKKLQVDYNISKLEYKIAKKKSLFEEDTPGILNASVKTDITISVGANGVLNLAVGEYNFPPLSV
ncbi:hypothetical protein [Acetobacter fallax]|uniref:Uncharacterized protein n=1 Tax=Acetobacter fallax TaxID=1737473 RepID=A0ABX0KKW0_9PROT|nr:hypothetical protein [Acetobacter fallax]NHO34502.1 hypothetical protein [Acetobacter fallax]NHO38059.1 hypothetical protein [Acetobacter fallax]